ATPNLPEAEVLSGLEIRTLEAAKEAAKAIADLGPSVVVVKGGHLPGEPVDVVWDGSAFHELRAERIETTATHGTGCTFSAAIAANLALGLDPLDAISAAKRYLTEALRHGYAVGDGHSPVDHFWAVRRVGG
ncbi:MAG: hydroxymethylpyrimidine/phosphomethylpyrimidine kinase, partial [Chloroflexota bacterium]